MNNDNCTAAMFDGCSTKSVKLACKVDTVHALKANGVLVHLQ
jgi:hypothetical protein